LNFQNIYDLHFSIAKPSKKQCGDASISFVHKNENKEIIVAIVADGVSSAPKDYLASKIVVNCIHQFILNASNNNLSQLLDDAVNEANRILKIGNDNTSGMLSTVCVAIYDLTESKIHYTHVGDSRIYAYKNQHWVQLTEDMSTTIQIKENGKLKLHNGLPVTRSLLSYAMGGKLPNPLPIIIADANDYAGFALLTDGMYGLTNWEEYITKYYHAANAEVEIQKDIASLLNQITDDASFAIFRIKPNLEKENKLDHAKCLIIPNYIEKFKEAIKSQNDTLALNYLIEIEKNNLILPKPEMIGLLEDCIKQNCSQTIQKLTIIIRRL
jgi:serine/threonine protein phosphatase PrpC